MSRDLFYTLLAILFIKGIFMFADSKPAYFGGDSEEYLATATVRYIPPDRSFLYGFLLRRVAYHTHSLEAMIWMQVLLSAIAAWLLSFTLRKIFFAPCWLAAVFGILCSLEPLQLLSERYVLTESCANFLFVVHFVLAVLYIKRGRLWALVGTQAIGVVLMGFRISFAPEVLISSVMVPLLSPYAIALLGTRKSKISARQIGLVAGHLCLSVLVSQGLLTEYRHWYGRLRGREPALVYQEGAFLLTAFSPLTEPEDFPVPSKRAAIFDNLRYDPHDILMRPAQHFLEGGLWLNIRKEFPDEKQANDLAVATAIHAVLRQPAGPARLAFQTFLLYFNFSSLQRWVLSDEGVDDASMSSSVRDWLQNLYGVSAPRQYEPSLTKQWHLFALPWYWVLLCSLALSPLTLLVRPKTDWPLLILCISSALLFFETATLVVDRPTPRFLTSAAWLVFLLFGLTAAGYWVRTEHREGVD